MDKRRKVVTQVYGEDIACYFCKTCPNIFSDLGSVRMEMLAELETLDGRLIYVSADKIKFID